MAGRQPAAGVGAFVLLALASATLPASPARAQSPAPTCKTVETEKRIEELRGRIRRYEGSLAGAQEQLKEALPKQAAANEKLEEVAKTFAFKTPEYQKALAPVQVADFEARNCVKGSTSCKAASTAGGRRS